MSVKSEREAQQRDRGQRSDNGKYRGPGNIAGIDMHILYVGGGFELECLESFVSSRWRVGTKGVRSFVGSEKTNELRVDCLGVNQLVQRRERGVAGWWCHSRGSISTSHGRLHGDYEGVAK